VVVNYVGDAVSSYELRLKVAKVQVLR